MEKLPIRITRVEPVERGQARRGLRLEIGEDVVLDDGQVVRRRGVRMRCAVCGESVAPVGLWSAELVT